MTYETSLALWWYTDDFLITITSWKYDDDDDGLNDGIFVRLFVLCRIYVRWKWENRYYAIVYCLRWRSQPHHFLFQHCCDERQRDSFDSIKNAAFQDSIKRFHFTFHRIRKTRSSRWDFLSFRRFLFSFSWMTVIECIILLVVLVG